MRITLFGSRARTSASGASHGTAASGPCRSTPQRGDCSGRCSAQGQKAPPHPSLLSRTCASGLTPPGPTMSMSNLSPPSARALFLPSTAAPRSEILTSAQPLCPHARVMCTTQRQLPHNAQASRRWEDVDSCVECSCRPATTQAGLRRWLCCAQCSQTVCAMVRTMPVTTATTSPVTLDLEGRRLPRARARQPRPEQAAVGGRRLVGLDADGEGCPSERARPVQQQAQRVHARDGGREGHLLTKQTAASPATGQPLITPRWRFHTCQSTPWASACPSAEGACQSPGNGSERKTRHAHQSANSITV